MESIVTTLLKRYETGGLTRRDLIQGLTMLAAGTAAGSAAAQTVPPAFQWAPLIDHVQINSQNVRASTEFYQKVLGLDLLRLGPPNDRNCCPDESAFFGVGKRLILAVRKAEPVGVIHHWALLMNNFDQAAVAKELKARGIETASNPATGFHVVDPDGSKIQLMGQPGPA